MSNIKKYFITGVLIWLPLGATVWVLNLLISTMDKSLLLIPQEYAPEHLLGVDYHIPGIGTILTLFVIFFTGLLTANFVGQKVVQLWEAILHKIPVVKSIYSSVKQVSDTIFSSSGQAFSRAVLVEYPRRDLWTIAFVTGQPGGEVANHLEDHISIYVPTTPNPTSGFFLIVPKKDTIELKMSVDSALKYIISMGVVVPAESVQKAKNQGELK